MVVIGWSRGTSSIGEMVLGYDHGGVLRRTWFLFDSRGVGVPGT